MRAVGEFAVMLQQRRWQLETRREVRAENAQMKKSLREMGFSDSSDSSDSISALAGHQVAICLIPMKRTT